MWKLNDRRHKALWLFCSPLLRNGLGSETLDPGDHRVEETVWDWSILATSKRSFDLKVGNAFQLDWFPSTPSLAKGSFWVGKVTGWDKNCPWQESTEPAHPTLKQGWPHGHRMNSFYGSLKMYMTSFSVVRFTWNKTESYLYWKGGSQKNLK